MASKASEVKGKRPSTNVDHIDSSNEERERIDVKEDRLTTKSDSAVWGEQKQSTLSDMAALAMRTYLPQTMAYNELVEDGRIRMNQDNLEMLSADGCWVAVHAWALYAALKFQTAKSNLVICDVKPTNSQYTILAKTFRKEICDICLDCTEVLKLSCQHFICATCTSSAFDLAAKDESLFPPTCCRRIPVAVASLYLSHDLHAKYKKKAVEFTTKDRMYCSAEGCSEFIPPEIVPAPRHTLDNTLGDENNINAKCPGCGSWTCVTCRGIGHSFVPCPKDFGDPEDKAAVDTAVDQGWQRCTSCKRFIERVGGCRYIHCICSHDFCYKCGADEGLCECESDDDTGYEEYE